MIDRYMFAYADAGDVSGSIRVCTSEQWLAAALGIGKNRNIIITLLGRDLQFVTGACLRMRNKRGFV